MSDEQHCGDTEATSVLAVHVVAKHWASILPCSLQHHHAYLPLQADLQSQQHHELHVSSTDCGALCTTEFICVRRRYHDAACFGMD
jgi:hypothetical protein